MTVVAVLLLMNVVPLLAADEGSEPLLFDAWITADGIYGSLNYLPEDTMSIGVLYSFGGESFDVIEDFQWDLTELPERGVVLTQLCIFADEHPFTAYQQGAVNSLYIKLNISRMGEDLETNIIRFSYNNSYPIPDTQPEFTAQVKADSQGYYQVNGRFSDFPANVMRVRPMYSLDGQNYQVVSEEYPNDWYLNDMGTEDSKKKYNLENQLCVMGYEEPLKSYLAKDLDQFYIRLQITREDGQTYNTQAACIGRGVVKPIPEDSILRADFPFTMRATIGGENPVKGYGQYQITAREDYTADDIRALLPDTLPVEVKIFEKDTGKFLTSGTVECKTVWKDLPALQLMAGEAITIQDSVDELMVPEGAEVVTPLGVYMLPSSLCFEDSYCTDEVRLMVNVIGNEAKSHVALKERTDSVMTEDNGVLALAFHEKPSGATSIKAYSFVNEDDVWTELCDLIEYRDVNHNQAAALYGYVNLLRPDEPPLVDYVNGEIPGFSIGLIIEGGIFDGERIVLAWPGEYNPPEEIIEPESSEGNENNAGPGNNEDGSDSNGGLHPGVPEGDKPPAEILPPEDLQQSSESESQIIPPAAAETEVSPRSEKSTKQNEPKDVVSAKASAKINQQEVAKKKQEDSNLLKPKVSMQSGFSMKFVAVFFVICVVGAMAAVGNVITRRGVACGLPKFFTVLKRFFSHR